MRREMELRDALDFWLLIHSLRIIGSKSRRVGVENAQRTVLVAMYSRFSFLT